MKSRSGITLIEVLMATAISAITLAAAASLFKMTAQSWQQLTAKESLELTLLEAQKYIRRVGRVANSNNVGIPSCLHVSGSSAGLYCTINTYEMTGLGVRFVQNGSDLDYDQCSAVYNLPTWNAATSSWTPPTCTAGGWTTVQIYSNVGKGFTVCDEYDLQDGNCLISSATGIVNILSLGGVPVDGRFFLYQLSATVPISPTNPVPLVLSYRSSFYVRNPVGAWAPGYTFLW